MAIFTVGPTSNFPTIAAAMAVAGTGDIIAVEAGYGNENATVTVDGLSFDGGPASTDINLQLTSGISRVTLLGTAPINVLDAPDANTIVGNDGDNIISVSSGVDVVTAANGTDRLIIDYSAATAAITGTTVDVTDGGTHAVTFTGVENFTITTGSGNDTITVGDGSNVLATGTGDDTITAGNGPNIIDGGASNDTITAGSGVNTIFGRSGNDTIVAGDGGNTIDGGDGDDGISTGIGDDVVIAGLGNDTIITSAGADVTTVNGGIDTVDSGSESDRLIVDFSSSTTAVNGGVTGGTLAGGYDGAFADVAGTSSVVFQGTENFTVTTGSGNDVIATGDGGDVLDGGAGSDQLNGGGGSDTLLIGLGNDALDGGAGTDTVLFSGARANYQVNDLGGGVLQSIDLRAGSPDGTDTFVNMEGFVFTDGTFDAVTVLTVPTVFSMPEMELAAFNPANGWTSEDQFPRHLADVNGDGSADIVGFGNSGVYVSLANGDGSFTAPTVTLAGAFNPNNGWTSDNAFHRELADVNGDHMADIVGFGNGGVYVSLATGGGNFDPLSIKMAAFNPNNGWTSQDQFPREMADVNGDGMADIVGFGNSGVYVSLATGDGDFAPLKVGLAGALDPTHGWTSQDQFPRELADVNGDGMADIVGFGNSGAYVALATGDGNFATPIVGVAALNAAHGWTSQDQFPRELADVNGDHMADIIGFGPNGVNVSLATGGGHFAEPVSDIAAFNPASGWSSNDAFPRELADVNGDGMADIVGFGHSGALVALANDFQLV